MTNALDKPTINEVKENNNYLCCLDLKNLDIFVSLEYQGSHTVKYYLFFNNELLFSGNDFRPSILNNVDDLESIVCLCGFLTLKEGDTDQEYFKNYTPEQIAFTKTMQCQDLNSYVSDFDNSNDNEYHLEVVKYFKEAFDLTAYF